MILVCWTKRLCILCWCIWSQSRRTIICNRVMHTRCRLLWYLRLLLLYIMRGRSRLNRSRWIRSRWILMYWLFRRFFWFILNFTIRFIRLLNIFFSVILMGRRLFRFLLYRWWRCFLINLTRLIFRHWRFGLFNLFIWFLLLNRLYSVSIWIWSFLFLWYLFNFLYILRWSQFWLIFWKLGLCWFFNLLCFLIICFIGFYWYL